MPSGHFVVLCGYDNKERQVLVADPLLSRIPYRAATSTW